MGVKIIATPNPRGNLGGGGLDQEFMRVANAANRPGGWRHVRDYTSLDDMFEKVRWEMSFYRANCLEDLEIDAHGSPGSCDAIRLTPTNTAEAFGNLLKSQPNLRLLCDEVHIFLNGCNTAVRTAGHESISQQVSRHTPTRAAHGIHVVVCGTVGYSKGTQMEGNIKTERKVWVQVGRERHLRNAFPRVSDGRGGFHPGSMEARGARSWRGFVEGRPL